MTDLLRYAQEHSFVAYGFVSTSHLNRIRYGNPRNLTQDGHLAVHIDAVATRDVLTDGIAMSQRQARGRFAVSSLIFSDTTTITTPVEGSDIRQSWVNQKSITASGSLIHFNPDTYRVPHGEYALVREKDLRSHGHFAVATLIVPEYQPDAPRNEVYLSAQLEDVRPFCEESA